MPAMPTSGEVPVHRRKDQCFSSAFADLAWVATLLKPKQVRSDPRAQAAIVDEAAKLLRYQVYDLDSVRERSEVTAEARRTSSKVHLGFIFAIVSIKNSELDESDPLRKYKARLVFSGHRITDEYGAEAVFDDLASSTTTMAATRFTVAVGHQDGWVCELADAESAYLQAELTGEATWVELPEFLWPSSWVGRFTRPMVLLKRALYGHPQAGLLWERKRQN